MADSSLEQQVSFEHVISFLTARISVERPNIVGESIGTGFFYLAPLKDNSNRSIILLISNKHVFVDETGILTISLNEKTEQGEPDYGKVQRFVQNNFSDIFFQHPNNDVDLACINASGITDTNAFYRYLNHAFLEPIDYKKIAPGSNVIFVGYPENRYDVVHNLPLVRKGSIASIPSVDFNGKGHIVIDAQVFQGSSGSPVFVSYDDRYYLMGVVTETMIRHSQLQTLTANIQQLGVEQILGLGIIIKQKHVQELIDYAVEEYARRNPTL